MSEIYPAPYLITCPGWCVIEHTDNPAFHKSEMRSVEDFGKRLTVNLFQATGEDSAPRLLIAGAALTVERAREFAILVAAVADLPSG